MLFFWECCFLFRHLISYVTYIDRIIVSAAACVAVPMVGVFPRLWREPAHVWRSGNTLNIVGRSRTCLWDGSIVPDVAFVWKHVGDVAKIPLLYVLFQWIQGNFGGYLVNRGPKNAITSTQPTHLKDGLCIAFKRHINKVSVKSLKQ